MSSDVKEITIDGVEYVRKDSIPQPKEVTDGYVIVRTYSAGVFAGYLKSRAGKEGVLTNARRLWRWYGAQCCSDLAMSGVSKPNECKFPEPVTEITLTEIIEIIPATLKAKNSIEGVPIWIA